jgi:flagella basal body P-ring formation protein FlgA
VLKAGQRATLLLSDPGFRATIPVVCLQTGLPGVDIRVRDEISGRIYRAQVADGGEVTLLPQ